jgi:hypothetical protein
MPEKPCETQAGSRRQGDQKEEGGKDECGTSGHRKDPSGIGLLAESARELKFDTGTRITSMRAMN